MSAGELDPVVARREIDALVAEVERSHAEVERSHAEVDRCHMALAANGLLTLYAMVAEVEHCHELLEANGISWIEA